MPATLATVQKQVISILNANTSGVYDTSISDDRMTAGFIDECIFQADEDVITAIAETPGHWARSDYLDWCTAITNSDDPIEIPSHLGQLGRVVVRPYSGTAIFLPSTKATLEEILRYKENDSNSYGAIAHNASGSSISRFVHISEEDLLYFTGYQAKIRMIVYARTAALQSPAAYTSAVSQSAATKALKEGGHVERAKYALDIAMGYDARIRANARATPDLELAA